MLGRGTPLSLPSDATPTARLARVHGSVLGFRRMVLGGWGSGDRDLVFPGRGPSGAVLGGEHRTESRFFRSTGVSRPFFTGQPAEYRPAGTTGRQFWAAQGRPFFSRSFRPAGRPPVDRPAG